MYVGHGWPLAADPSRCSVWEDAKALYTLFLSSLGHVYLTDWNYVLSGGKRKTLRFLERKKENIIVSQEKKEEY